MKAIFDVIVGDVLYAVTKKLDSVHEINVTRSEVSLSWGRYIFFEWKKSEYYFKAWSKGSNVIYTYNERPSTNIKKRGCSSPYKGILAIFSDLDEATKYLNEQRINSINRKTDGTLVLKDCKDNTLKIGDKIVYIKGLGWDKSHKTLDTGIVKGETLNKIKIMSDSEKEEHILDTQSILKI